MAIELAGSSYTRTLGRKRVVISNNLEASTQMTPLKRMCSGRNSMNSERSLLEALPLDNLVKVLSGVDHEDLKHLLLVSKTIKEATLIAKGVYFDYATPKKRTFAINPLDLEDANGFQEIEAPNAPLIKSKLRLKSVALFARKDEEK